MPSHTEAEVKKRIKEKLAVLQSHKAAERAQQRKSMEERKREQHRRFVPKVIQDIFNRTAGEKKRK